MAIPMTSLKRAPNGDWLARKGIPKDVRADYEAAFDVKWEERFRLSGSVSMNRAKQELRDWDAEISSRIEALRAKRKGDGQHLTPRQAHALAGEWYTWFVAQYEEEPGEAEDWNLTAEHLLDAHGSSKRVHQTLTALARVPQFLATKNIILTADASDRFLEVLRTEFLAALRTLRRWSEGDYSPDERPKRFPKYEQRKSTGLTVWGLFEKWVLERKPSDQTVDRWRAVLRNLDDHFGDKDVNEITEDEAWGWGRQLATEKRSAQTVKEVWLNAASTIFGWAVDQKLIHGNPFAGVKVTVPKKVKTRPKWFYPDEIRTILSATLDEPPSSIAVHYRAARRWVPWIQAYTGARAGEITQLRGSDVIREEGVWAIRLTPEAGTIKTKEARIVPLHDHLVEQQFLEFVEKVGEGPLFYDPSGRRKKLPNDPTKPPRSLAVKTRDKLAEWVRDIGVDDAELSPTHAWRHTFKRIADREGISSRVSNAITGHAQANEADKYGLPSVEDMAEALKRFPRYSV